jgi:hypothetical protein
VGPRFRRESEGKFVDCMFEPDLFTCSQDMQAVTVPRRHRAVTRRARVAGDDDLHIVISLASANGAASSDRQRRHPLPHDVRVRHARRQMLGCAFLEDLAALENLAAPLLVPAIQRFLCNEPAIAAFL